MEVSIIICTANRASDLRGTLDSIATIRTPGLVELLVVDNRSTDDTRQVIEAAARWFPFPVRYLFEGEQGKYGALNTGIKASRGRVIAATDDDARFEADWLERAVEGLAEHGCGFVGGRVCPIWMAPKPDWLDDRASMYQKVIAILDYGPDVREFGRGIAWPLGVNVAYRRDVFERVGLFEKRLGRTLGTLRNQAQREWHLRARAAGVRGIYLPAMVVHHLIPPERLKKAYFRRWMYWNGISRAILYREGGYDIEEPDLEHPPNPRAPQFLGVPYPLWWKGARSLRSLVWHGVNGHGDEALQRELWLCSFAGVARQRWADRRRPVADKPATRVEPSIAPPESISHFEGRRVNDASSEGGNGSGRPRSEPGEPEQGSHPVQRFLPWLHRDFGSTAQCRTAAQLCEHQVDVHPRTRQGDDADRVPLST